MNMQVGDKVRMLRDKESGRVTKIISEKLIEVEIEDGFRIPVLRSELVLVAAEENNYFEREEPVTRTSGPVTTPKEPPVAAGFALAFHALNDKAFSVYLINNTKNIIPYSLYYQRGNVSGKAAGHLNPLTYIKVDELDRRDFENWPEMIVQALTFSKEIQQIAAPFEKRFKFKAVSFFKNEKMVPLILKRAYLFEIDTPIKAVDIEKLNVRFAEGTLSNIDSESNRYERPDPIIDLHIEKLVTDHKSLTPAEILQFQLQAFEKAVDMAVAGSMEEITFIHGAGNGVLRDAVHKLLSKNSHIEYYKDALKEKFGYGATVVRFK